MLNTVDRLQAELEAINREIAVIERLEARGAAGVAVSLVKKAIAGLRARRHDVLVNLAAWQDAALASDEE